jgi:hypothetical protein
LAFWSGELTKPATSKQKTIELRREFRSFWNLNSLAEWFFIIVLLGLDVSAAIILERF